MEVLSSREHIIFLDGKKSLWFEKHNFSSCSLKEDWSICNEQDLECVGSCFGIIGVIEPISGLFPKILVIKRSCKVGTLPDDKEVFRIDEVSLLEIAADGYVAGDLCRCHKHGGVASSRANANIGKSTLINTIGSFKLATNSLKNATAQAAVIASQVRPGSKKDPRDPSRLERKICDEILKLFHGTNSFYFCPTGDITKAVARQKPGVKTQEECEDRFFWNKALLSNTSGFNLQNRKDFFIPIIQGYFETARVPLFLQEEEEVSLDPNMIPMTESALPSLELTVISRRSRFRCGTRYLRRGVDENGYVANYVETEQIIRFSGHTVSFIQVRGSVPIYWSQPGYKYRPPPQLDKGELECQQAFKSHFNREVDTYGKICVVSLVEKIGKEKIIGDAFEKQILMHDSPDLAYAAFDFHDNCRGLRFENVELLVSALEEEMKAMKFSWIDSKGTICEQTGTFRVNCMDCLDRTNVVQMAVSRRVLLLILSKLGLVPPEGKVPESLLLAHQTLWANNGDAISKQYAGTNALKGDYTRTGKRKLAGMMKDGVNSASRFYINRFRDAFRQVAISILTGESIPNELLVSLTNEKTLVQDEPDITVTAERVKQVIEECRNLLLSDSEVAVGSWGVIDSHPASGDPTQTDMDLILIITQEMLYVIDYDDEDDELERYYPIPFANIEAIEFGPDVQGSISLNFLRGSSQRSRTQSSAVHHLKISYKIGNKSGYLVQCRSTRLRFFNNMAIPIKIDEEIVESLRAICETIVMTLEVHGYTVPVFYGPIVKRKGSIPIASGIPLAASTGGERGRSVLSQLGFNLSADTAAIVDAGSKALMNVTHQLARLSPSSIRRHLQSPLRSDSGRCASAMSHGAQVHYTPSRAPTPYFHYPFIEDVYVTTAGIIAVHSPKGDAAKVSSSSLAPKSKSPKLLKDTRRTTSFSNSGPMVVSRYTIPFEKLPEATPEIRISAPVQLPKVDMMLPLRDISGTDVGSRSSTPGSTILSALTSPLGRLSDSIVILSPNSGNPLTKIARGVQNLSNFDMRRSRPKPIELPEIQRLKLSSKTKFIEV